MAMVFDALPYLKPTVRPWKKQKTRSQKENTQIFQASFFNCKLLIFMGL